MVAYYTSVQEAITLTISDQFGTALDAGYNISSNQTSTYQVVESILDSDNNSSNNFIKYPTGTLTNGVIQDEVWEVQYKADTDTNSVNDTSWKNFTCYGVNGDATFNSSIAQAVATWGPTKNYYNYNRFSTWLHFITNLYKNMVTPTM